MEKAVVTLRELRDNAILKDTKLRLTGKIQGVEVAMGYIHEDIRRFRDE